MLRDARRLVDRRRKAGVTPAASAATGNDQPRAVLGQITDRLILLDIDYGDLRPDRHLQDEVIGVAAVLVRVLPLATGQRSINATPPELLQVTDGVSCLQNDIPTLRSVSAVWPALRNVLLPAEGDRAVSTIPTSYDYLNTINHAVIIDSVAFVFSSGGSSAVGSVGGPYGCAWGDPVGYKNIYVDCS